MLAEAFVRLPVIGKVDGRSVALGNLTLLKELSIDTGPLLARAEELRREGHIVIFFAVIGSQSAGIK
jgi:P-type Cu+ transporter